MKVLTEIAKDALELTANQRFTLARILLELTEDLSDSDPGAEQAWENEIARRIRSIKEGTAVSRSSEDMFADLDCRFPV